jgi:sugar lactone lactonase YvrE
LKTQTFLVGSARLLGAVKCEREQTATDKLSIATPEAKVQKLVDGFRFTEGPAADAEGNIFFTDIPNSRIHKWPLDGKLSTFLEDSGKANGLFFDKDGNLLACVGGRGQSTVLQLHNPLSANSGKIIMS